MINAIKIYDFSKYVSNIKITTYKRKIHKEVFDRITSGVHVRHVIERIMNNELTFIKYLTHDMENKLIKEDIVSSIQFVPTSIFITNHGYRKFTELKPTDVISGIVGKVYE